MRVLEFGDHLGFGFEALYKFRMLGELRQDNLDRNLAFNGWLFGAVDDAEAAFADALDQLIASNFLTAKIFHFVDPDEKSYP